MCIHAAEKAVAKIVCIALRADTQPTISRAWAGSIFLARGVNRKYHA
jgi:hypothetical protein